MGKIKALSLLSGGLDSTLATKLIIEQNIEVVAINFFTPFCRCNRIKGCNSSAKFMAEKLNIEIRRYFLGEEYLRIVKNPKFGYGKNLNPCIDCRILMLKKTKEIMEKEGFSFIITGEVLNQRPKSQTFKALKIIEKETGLEGLILRPLSAQFLPITIPEKEGWVDRKKLLSIKGRSRKQQIFFADFFGIKDYPCPSGGCLLTDPIFAKKCKDLLEFGEFNLHNVNLLKIGRHFRINPFLKLIIGRDEDESKRLYNMKKEEDFILKENKTKIVGILKGCKSDFSLSISLKVFSKYVKSKEIIVEKFGKEEKYFVEELDEIPSFFLIQKLDTLIQNG
jgi:tRNA-specific 2-thiouridylase